jgi:hypothetical protein
MVDNFHQQYFENLPQNMISTRDLPVSTIRKGMAKPRGENDSETT